MSHLKILKCFSIKNIVIWLGMSLSFTPGMYSQQKSMLIWFDTPAYQPKVFTYETPEFKKQFHFENKGWNEALRFGNSRMGAMAFGSVFKERIQLYEKSLWDGSRHNDANTLAAPALPEIQKLMFEGNIDPSQQLAGRTMLFVPVNIHPYQSLGDLFIEHLTQPADTIYTGYRRWLSLDSAVAVTTYTHNGVNYRREVYASHPANVIICVDEATTQKFIRLMTEYNQLAHAVGSDFHMNPSPGNISDGLITDSIKSIGAAKKGGTSPVTDVLDYAEQAKKNGLNLVCTPGNDVEATTGKVAAGATLILFTTGLGTPTGNPICPAIKIATSTQLATRMSDIIDIDTGGIIEGTKTIEQMGEEILEYAIRAASGEVKPKAVLLNQDDFIPWKRGVSL